MLSQKFKEFFQWSYLLTFVFISTNAIGSSPLENKPIFLKLDVDQGYNFKVNNQKPYGYLTKLKIGNREFQADQKVINHKEPGKYFSVVGVLQNVHWEGRSKDGINLSAQISATNKSEIQTLIMNPPKDFNVEFSFVCFDFDPKLKQYHQTFHCNEITLKGILDNLHNTLALYVDDNASTQVLNPKNFNFFLTIKPQEKQGLFVYAQSFEWGEKESKLR